MPSASSPLNFLPGGRGSIGISQLLSKLESYLPPEQVSRAQDAYDLAHESHRGQKRMTGEAYITHPVLSGPAVDRIKVSELDEIVVTDTIPLSENARACGKIRQLSVAELLAETLRRINESDSVSSLYLD